MTTKRETSIIAEDDPMYPSGPWVGFFNYGPGGARFRQEMDLTFRNRRLAGDGFDGELGAFVIRGGFDPGRQKVWWTKTYPASHDVWYQGFREGKGIWGTWEIAGVGRGGFMIWPKALGEEPGLEAAAEEEEPVSAAVSPILPASRPKGT